MLFLQRSQRLIKHLSRSQYRQCRCYSDSTKVNSIKHKMKTGPGLKDFLLGSSEPILSDRPHIPYLSDNYELKKKQKIYFDVYGCQMNLNDTEIVWSILKKEGFEKTEVEDEADIFLVMTCAIREGAETKIWHRLDHLRGFKRRGLAKNKQVKIGILGCMAERLKTKLIEKEKSVDIVAGPDSYRDLPRLLAVTESGRTAVNVLLSLDETYADVVPVRLNEDSVSAFISIMRGCDNMCTYCIVPWTRGRERSRPARSVAGEVRELAARGVRDLTLLGQNVNSYRDVTESGSYTHSVEGFKTVYKPKVGGLRFADLLDQVSAVDPDMRIRFTAAHPKDFPDEVLQVIAERPNICKLLHLPAQSGSSAVLERMRRGHTREAYLQLVRRVRDSIPGVGLSTDMICGFCGETEEEFEQTLSLMEEVRYHQAFLFPYSMREKTTAHRRYKDDVPDQVKKERHNRMVALYRKHCQQLNQAEVGNTHLVLVEGVVKKTGQLMGRNEFYMKVVFDQTPLGEAGAEFLEDCRREQGKLGTKGGEVTEFLSDRENSLGKDGVEDLGYLNGKVDFIKIGVVKGLVKDVREIRKGDYVAVRIEGAKASVLSGSPLFRTTLTEFYRDWGWADRSLLRI